jgi:pimeloyl-ACP methyl ester carboxylesterase
VAVLLMACSGSQLPAEARADESLQGERDDGVQCRTFAAIPVALGPDEPSSETVSGELCARKKDLVAGATVQLLVHGATYNRDYWDFGVVDGIRYSYARDVAARGFPTFAMDEIGSGNSSRPPSARITIQAAAFAAHQMIQALRQGDLGDVPFVKVITVGHSLGSVVVWEEAILYGDADGVIVTGAAHALTTAFLNLNPFLPASSDPRFSDQDLDPGYLTTVPGIRAAAFYHPPDADPAVIARDEQLKDLVAGPELGSGLPVVTSAATLAIQVPVLTILGDHDLPTCGPNSGGTFDCSSGAIVVRQEAAFYSPQARIRACVVPGAGHDLSLALNHSRQVADAVAWSSAFVGQRSGDEERELDQRDGERWDESQGRLPPGCGAPESGDR